MDLASPWVGGGLGDVLVVVVRLGWLGRSGGVGISGDAA